MDIRTKLIFAFVAASLLSMAVLGAYSYGAAADILRAISERQLDALASARAQDISVLARAWRDQVNLIQSRTELRRQLAGYPADPRSAKTRIERIVVDAERSVDVITRITVYDAGGRFVATAGTAETRGQPIGQQVFGDVGVSQYVKRSDGGIDAVLSGALELSGEVVGYLATVVDTRDLMRIVESRRGLGESGEMMLVAEFRPGVVTQFNPPRHQPGDWLATYPLAEASDVVKTALSGHDEQLLDVLDHRGEPVWAAVRTLPGIPGCLLVKIDAREELAPVTELRGKLIDVALSVAALAILGGALVGIVLARPIRLLNQVVERIRHGEADLRADESGEDEVSFLAESFNDLMDQMGRPR